MRISGWDTTSDRDTTHTCSSSSAAVKCGVFSCSAAHCCVSCSSSSSTSSFALLYKEFVLLFLPLANDDDDAMHGGVSSSLIFDSPFTSIFTTGAEVQMNFRSLERGEIYQIYESSCKLYGIHPRSANRSHLLLNNNYYDVWNIFCIAIDPLFPEFTLIPPIFGFLPMANYKIRSDIKSTR